MSNKINVFLLGVYQQNNLNQNIGFFLLRFFVGLAFCTVFEKFLPKDGVWGPQEWFIQDTADMGFPFPVFFAWVAVLSEFFGGILLMLGLFTRPAALLNAGVTFIATFIYHKGDIGDAGLLSFFFLVMCLCIVLFGPGTFSLDYVLNKRLTQRKSNLAVLVLLLLFFIPSTGHAYTYATIDQEETTSVDSSSVQFYVKNNSLLPKKVTFIIYQPQQEGNNTRVRWFLPFQRVPFKLPVRSKVYIASDEQISRVMQGKRIDSDSPFVRVEIKLSNATLPLNRRD